MRARNLLTIAAVAILALAVMVGSGYGQVYVQTFPNPNFKVVDPKTHNFSLEPCFHCINRDRPTLRRWHIYNRFRSVDELTRSPLNPESSLDYMLRTF